MEWNSTLYDKKHDFVVEYGKGLLEFIPKNDEQSILDLGCGTGVLTFQLADLCSKIVGVDRSQNMIDKAKEQFFASELAAMSEKVQALVFEKVEELTRDMLWNGMGC